jgi:hypothetical protein
MITKMGAGAQHPVTVKEALQYDAAALQTAIEKCEENIELFEKTIEGERNTIKRYEEMITIIKLHKKP